MKRREVIKKMAALPLAGALGSAVPYTALAAPSDKAPGKRNLFQELGVRTFINAAGTLTYMTGSLMHDYVLEAITGSATEFCMLDELQDKVGERIAAMVHSEAAVVTSGAFSGMTLGLAGILSGTDLKKVEQIPHLQGTAMKSEVICQKGHEIVYNHAFTNTGCTIKYVETVEELEAAINSNTALLHFLNIQADRGKITHEQWVQIGKKYNIPTSIDIAADIPPVSNLWRFNDMGFSFVVVSGGKAIRGPQSAGLLMGKKEIITAARLHMPPRGFNIGRGMKINKEEILGMYVALEQYMQKDHEKEWKEWEEKIGLIENAVKNINGVQAKVSVPKLGNITPTLNLSWDRSKIKLSSAEMHEQLRKGQPSIEVGGTGADNSINVTVWMLKPGQEKVVARRIKEELQKALMNI